MKKIVLLKIVAVIVTALLCVSGFYAQGATEPKLVIYVNDPARVDPVTGAHPEIPVRDNIVTATGYNVVFFPVAPHPNVSSPERLDSLKNADLIIIGRAVGSTNWTTAWRDTLNALKTPVLSINPWSTRGTHLGWLFGAAGFGGAATEQLMTRVNYPADPVFEGITLDVDNQMHLWNDRYNFSELDTIFPGNGQIMIQNVVGEKLRAFFVRFTAGVPFYEGGITPAGPRTYFGLGDDGGVIGEPPVQWFNYWGFSADGATVFIREIQRLANLPRPVNVIETQQLSVSVFPNPATNNLAVRMNNLNRAEIWDLTGKLMFSVDGNGPEVNIDISALNAGIYFVRAIDINNNAVVRRIVKK